MSDKEPRAHLAAVETIKTGDPEFARRLREIADKVEAGTVREIVVVLDDLGDMCFERTAIFTDRWKLLAAIEYSKAGLLGLA